MNELKIFQKEDLGQVRTLLIDSEPWFVAKDICEILEVTNVSDALKRLDEDERSRFNLGRQGETNIINESGLYSLILGSRKPEAKKFKRWITSEVIPSIRKHGSYMTAEKIEEVLLNPDTMITLLNNLKEEKSKRLEAEEKIKLDAPKVTFADSVATSKATILIGELAKIIKQNGVNIGQKRLFDWLRSNGYLVKRKGSEYNMPTQRSMEIGLFEIKESSINHSDGHISLTKTTKVTGKGQQYFINLFLKDLKAVN